MDMTHDDLVVRADKWLKALGCGVTLREFRAVTEYGEQPDAIGWMCGISVMIECKATRRDFLSDKKKKFRKQPELGMGDWRFYMCPKGVIQPADLPDGWGLLWCYPRQVQKVHGVPYGNIAWVRPDQTPFQANKGSEMQMMYSALRRMVKRGHLGDVYQPIEPVEVG